MLNDANIARPELHDRLRDGIVLPIDKPPGMTSFGVVARIKRLLPHGIKIGHAGTLDPFATGLLLILIGKATRQCEAMMDQPKTYDATIRLGATSDTDDLTGEICVTPEATAPALATLEQRLATMIGDVSQRPPVYSAIKINGRRACDRVRQGHAVELKPRIVKIYDIDLLGYDWPELQVRVDCGRGTYIRSIARDLGEALGIGGYLTHLRRTRIGSYDVAMAKQLNDLASDSTQLYNASALVPSPGTPGEGQGEGGF